jgi:hypothetical protein
MFKRLTIIVIVAVLFSQAGVAKDKKIKFGKVSIEEMNMTVYSLDTSAPAVILYEGLYYDPKMYASRFFRRIKILKPEGLYMGNDSFSTTARGDIKGITYNMEGEEIVESKLDKKTIYEEKVWDYEYEYNIAMPDVKVGSVIDVEVRFEGFPTRWFFQHSVPTVKSELEFGDSQYVTFREQLGGIIQPKEVGYKHWAVEDMPAFISEPYLSSSKNYLSYVELDISQINFPNHYPLDFASSWEAVDNYLMGHSRFGDGLKWPSTFLNKYADEIEENAHTQKEKAQLAVEKIKAITTWNGADRVFLTRDNLSESTSQETCNSADINLTLIKLLTKLDIESYPLVMSTRSNGLLHPFYPSLFKLNYVMAYARVDGEFIILDATDDRIPYDMLPIRCLNYTGRVLDHKGTQSVSLVSPKKYSKRIYHDLILTDDFLITGKASYMNGDYAAYDFRKDFSDYLTQQDYVNEVMDANDGLVITDFALENIQDVNKPVVEKYDVEIENAVMILDQQAFINMFLFEQMKENPFKSEERKYPIDFIYPRTTSGVVRLALPKNMSVAELPSPMNVVLPNNAGKFVMMYQVMNDVITLNYSLVINNTVFAENEYLNIKELYGHIIGSESNPVILDINNE